MQCGFEVWQMWVWTPALPLILVGLWMNCLTLLDPFPWGARSPSGGQALPLGVRKRVCRCYHGVSSSWSVHPSLSRVLWEGQVLKLPKVSKSPRSPFLQFGVCSWLPRSSWNFSKRTWTSHISRNTFQRGLQGPFQTKSIGNEVLWFLKVKLQQVWPFHLFKGTSLLGS